MEKGLCWGALGVAGVLVTLPLAASNSSSGPRNFTLISRPVAVWAASLNGLLQALSS